MAFQGVKRAFASVIIAAARATPPTPGPPAFGLSPRRSSVIITLAISLPVHLHPASSI